MEVKEKSKKREMIKTVAIVFLTVLLLLTFFSGTIMNHSLPEVATQLVSSGTINAKIRGSGAVAANESYEVNIKQTREIRSVCVKVGDKVEQGDLLFVLGDVESAELKTAQEALENARIAYQRRMLELSKDYADDDQSVKTLREDLERALALRDANYITDAEVSFAKGDLADANTRLSNLQFALDELKALQSESEEYANAKAEVAELETKIKGLESALEDYEEQLEKLEDGEDTLLARKIEDAKDALSKAEHDRESSWMAYIADLNGLIDHMNNGDIALENFKGYKDKVSKLSESSPEEITPNAQVYIEAYLTEWGKTKLDNSDEKVVDFYKYEKGMNAYKAIIDAQKDVEEKETALQRLKDDLSIASGNASDQRRALRNKRDEADGQLAAARRDLRAAQQRLDAASSGNAQLKEAIRVNEADQRQLTADIAVLKERLETLQEKQKTYKEASDTADAKQRELERTMSGKNVDRQLDDLDLQSMRRDIDKQQELVDKYQKDSVDAEIVSPVSGVVTSIGVTAGKETSPGQAMATIDVVDRGYILKVPVTNEQARQVKVGDPAEVTNYFWGREVSAVLESVAPDPASGGQKKLLVFRISGDIDAGTNISLSIGQRSENYEALVPKSALREDANGKFVLVVTSKNTPLGNRYTAARADVQVLAEDDTSAAVTGLTQSDYVITTSSKPLDVGSQVRMVENP